MSARRKLRGQCPTRTAGFGLSRLEFARAEAVVDAALREPTKYARLVEQMDRTGKINGAFRQFTKMREAERIASEPPPLPTGPFRVIVADPPWQFECRADDLTME